MLKKQRMADIWIGGILIMILGHLQYGNRVR